MKCGARVALGVAGGYFLGRTKKMKLALMLGGMAAGRRGGSPGGLLGRGTALLDSSPELAALRDQISGRLVEAGKGAVMGLAARQLESLTDRVSDRMESLGDPDRLTGRRPGRRRRPSNGERPDSSADRADRDEDATEATDEYPSDDYAGDEPDGDQDEADSGRTRSSAPSRSRAGSSTGSSRTRASTRGTRAAGRTSAEPASGARRAGKAASSRSSSAAGSGTRNANARSGRGGRSER